MCFYLQLEVVLRCGLVQVDDTIWALNLPRRPIAKTL